MEDELTTLYRPVGRSELKLIRNAAFRRFQPRLLDQPFFYPVLNQQYAEQIARQWNTKDERSQFSGYVLRFRVRTDFLSSYEVHTVGTSEHLEYWIPALDLERFNDNIVGDIEVLSEFHGDRSAGTP
jgi:hypothetical protein